MRTVQHILLIALALLLQTSWVHAIAIYGVTPNLPLVALVYIGISCGQIEATILGFLSGFMLDTYGPPGSMGINALAGSVVGFAVGYSRLGVVAEDLRVQALTFFLAGVLYSLIYFTFDLLLNPAPAFSLVLKKGLGTACYTALAGSVFALLASIRFDGGIHLDVRRLHG